MFRIDRLLRFFSVSLRRFLLFLPEDINVDRIRLTNEDRVTICALHCIADICGFSVPSVSFFQRVCLKKAIVTTVNTDRYVIMSRDYFLPEVKRRRINLITVLFRKFPRTPDFIAWGYGVVSSVTGPVTF